MKRFKHSGALGDLVYSLAIMKQQGGGEFYLHLNQMDWIGQHYYGSPPALFHQGRMRQSDFDFMKTFMEAQEYVTLFDILDPSQHEITHNLDRFRPLFVGHPTNYIDIYANAFNLTPDEQGLVNSTPWLTVPVPKFIEGRPIVINRTQRWIPPSPGPAWTEFREQVEAEAVFVGLPEEYVAFTQQLGWVIPYHPTQTMLELASVIAGADVFIGNQSQCYALAVGLGVEDIVCEARVDLPLERNECYFPRMQNIRYI